MNPLRKAWLYGSIGLLLTGCGSSASSDSGQGPASSQAVLEFISAGQSVVEDGAPVAIIMRITLALPVDLTVTFGLSGTAQDGDDYSVDPGVLVIPAGDVQATVTLTPLVDSACELTETAILTLLSAPGAVFGGVRVHTVTVLDADTEIFSESEPNDEVAAADVVGTTVLGRCVEIQGNIQEGFPDPFDVFEFTTGAAVLVNVELRPGSDQMDMLLFVTDASGALILPAVQTTGAGEVETVAFEVEAGMIPEFNLSVSAFGPAGGYAMLVSFVPLPPSPQPSPGEPWLTDWAQLKESLRPGRIAGAPRTRLRPVGFGVLLDRASGAATSGLLVEPH